MSFRLLTFILSNTCIVKTESPQSNDAFFLRIHFCLAGSHVLVPFPRQTYLVAYCDQPETCTYLSMGTVTT